MPMPSGHNEKVHASPRINTGVFFIQGLAVLSVAVGLAIALMRRDVTLGGLESGSIPKAWAPPMWVYVAGGLGLLALGAVPLHPSVGLWVYVALAYGFPRYRPEQEFLLRSGLLEWVSVLTALGWAGWMIRHGRRETLPKDLLTCLLGALVAWAAVCAVTSYLTDRLWNPSVQYHPLGLVNVLVMFLLASTFLGDPRECCLLAIAIVGSLSVRAASFPQMVRHDGDISAMIAMALPLALQAMALIRAKIAKVAFAACAGYLLWVLYQTANRGAAVGLVAALLVLWVLARRKLLTLAVALPALPCLLVLFIGTHYWQRFADIWQGGPWQDSAFQRLGIWRAGWRMFLDHPLMGVGPSNFGAHVGTYAPALADVSPHNNFIAMLSETGALGMALYTAFFSAAIITLWRLARNSRESWPSGASRFLVSALVAYLVTGCFISRPTLVLPYVLAGAGLALRRISHIKGPGPGGAGPARLDHNSAEPERTPQADPVRSHKTYLVLLLCYLLFVVYGSLVPLHFQRVPLEKAWAQFLRIRYLSLGISSRADLVSNLLLLIPLTFFAMGAFGRQKAAASRWLVSVVIVAAACALSLAIEFAQIYFPPRTVSLNDILAETAGAALGIGCWFLWGNRITEWAKAVWRSRDEDKTAVRILSGYLVFLVLYQLLPFDVTIRPAELYHRLKGGRVSILPFGDIEMFSLYAVVSKIATAVPVGFLFCMANRKHSVFRATLLAVMFAAGIEFCQVFIFSRVASSTDVVIGAVGAFLGAWLAAAVGPASRKPLTQSPVWLRHRLWIKATATVAWIAVITWYKWRPFDFAWPGEGLFPHMRFVARVPLYFQYHLSEFMASAQVVRLLTVSFIAGMLVKSLAPARSGGLRPGVVIVAVAMMLEIGRLFLPNRAPDLVHAVLFIVGGIAGIRSFSPFTRLFLARPQGPKDDLVTPGRPRGPLAGGRSRL